MSRAWSTLLWAAAGLLAACGTEPDDRPFRATYVVIYEPAQLVSATENCDRLVDHVLLELGDEGSFEVSINVVDDCTHAGGGFTFSEVLRFGTYTRQGNTVVFTPEDAAEPAFTGTLEFRAIALVLFPGLDGLSSEHVELRVPLSDANQPAP